MLQGGDGGKVEEIIIVDSYRLCRGYLFFFLLLVFARLKQSIHEIMSTGVCRHLYRWLKLYSFKKKLRSRYIH